MTNLSLITLIIVSSFVIACSAIGMQYYDKCPDLETDDSMSRNRKFLIAMTVISSIAILGSFAGFFMGNTKKGHQMQQGVQNFARRNVLRQ